MTFAFAILGSVIHLYGNFDHAGLFQCGDFLLCDSAGNRKEETQIND